jgi:hypothetical protein
MDCGDVCIENLPYEILYHVISQFISITNMYSLKRTNSFFNELAKDVINRGKYNSNFLFQQKYLLNKEKDTSTNAINIMNEKIREYEKETENLREQYKIIKKRRDEYVKYKKNVKSLLRTIDLYSFGPPNIKMIIKTGFQRFIFREQHQLPAYTFILNYSYTNNIDSIVNYNLEYILKKLSSKSWFWVAKDNTPDNLQHVDKVLNELGWIKFFPLMKESDIIAFVYIHPQEPYLNNLNRHKFYDCPICKSPYHTMYSCEKAWCNCCHDSGHITNMCPKKYFKDDFKKKVK